MWILATDNAGNQVITSSNVFKIDNEKPSCAISGLPTNWTTSATLTVSGTDSNSGISGYSWDGTNYSSTKTKSIIANGTYTAYVKDNAGNVNNCSATISKIDRTGPSIPTLRLANESVNSSVLSFNAVISNGSTDSQSGVNRYEFSYNSGNTWTTSSSNSHSGAGFDYNVCARAVDNVGNVSGNSNCIRVNGARLFIRQLYRAVRPYGVNSKPSNYTSVEESEVDYWNNWSGYGDYLAVGLFSSQEFKYSIIGTYGGYYATGRVYIGALGREGDSGGLNYYGNTYWNSNGAAGTIVTLVTTDEAKNIYSKAGLAYYGVTTDIFNSMYNRY